MSNAAQPVLTFNADATRSPPYSETVLPLSALIALMFICDVPALMMPPVLLMVSPVPLLISIVDAAVMLPLLVRFCVPRFKLPALLMVPALVIEDANNDNERLLIALDSPLAAKVVIKPPAW